MAKWHRTVVAFLIAPLAAPIIYGVVAATMRPLGNGPTWIGSFRQWFALVGLISYGISYAIGIPAFLCLRRMHRESVLAYAAIGGVVGFLYLPVINGFIGLSLELVAISIIFALLGVTVGMSFGLIAGQRFLSNPTLDPAPTLVITPAGQEPSQD
jgi:hypothetical protein